MKKETENFYLVSGTLIFAGLLVARVLNPVRQNQASGPVNLLKTDATYDISDYPKTPDAILNALGQTINVSLVLQNPSGEKLASVDLGHPSQDATAFIKQLAQQPITYSQSGSARVSTVIINVKDAHGNPVCNISVPASYLTDLVDHAAADPATFRTAKSMDDLAKICGKNVNDIKVEYQLNKFSQGTLPYTLAGGVKADPRYQGGKYATAVEAARTVIPDEKSKG